MDCINIKAQLVRKAPAMTVQPMKDNIQATVSTLSTDIKLSVKAIKESIQSTVTTIPKLLKCSVIPFRTRLNMTVQLICTANYVEVLEWAKNVLHWDSNDNVVGTIKYNTLTASDDWSIEEVIVEELL